MIPYLIFGTLLIIVMLMPKIISTKFNYFTAFVLLFLFAALRGNGSGDYFTYLRYAELITSIKEVLNFSFPMEIGFRVLAYLNNLAGFHPQVVIAAMNLISLTCIYKFVDKYSPDKMLSILCFLPLYFQFDMHAARTAVAVGISTIGLKYLFENRLVKYTGIVFLAGCFHTAAWILLPFYFIRNLYLNRYLRLGSILMLALFSAVFSINDLILKFLQVLPFSYFYVKFSSYMHSSVFGYPFPIYDPRLILLLGINVAVFFFFRKGDRLENIFANLIWLNAVLMFVLRENTFFVTRLTAFFNIYTLVVIPLLLARYKLPGRKMEYAFIKLSTVYVYLLFTAGIVARGVEYKFFSI
ncbi:EpsG family protein [Cohnella caldifontis]|uniref:EpsG family protein n=1 Tax=Cohnella caldifontis TaxID=3027471 RepID=UPI0023ECFD63|nr:EpsG family protein [Cohnella sp. YIM B05605]